MTQKRKITKRWRTWIEVLQFALPNRERVVDYWLFRMNKQNKNQREKKKMICNKPFSTTQHITPDTIVWRGEKNWKQHLNIFCFFTVVVSMSQLVCHLKIDNTLCTFRKTKQISFSNLVSLNRSQLPLMTIYSIFEQIDRYEMKWKTNQCLCRWAANRASMHLHCAAPSIKKNYKVKNRTNSNKEM